MIAYALDYRSSSGVTYSEPFAGLSSSKKFAACCAIQAGIANDRAVFGKEPAIGGRLDQQQPSGHAFTDVIVGISGKFHMQTTGVEYAKALSSCASQVNGDG